MSLDMNIVLVIFTVASVLMSGIVLGIVVPFIFEIRSSKKIMATKVEAFDEITKKASEANVSLANKILQLEEKIANVEFWKQNSNTFKK